MKLSMLVLKVVSEEEEKDDDNGAGGRAEKPAFRAKIERSRACSPMAMATCFSLGEAGEVIMPKGILAREKCEPLGIETHDFDLLVVVGGDMS